MNPADLPDFTQLATQIAGIAGMFIVVNYRLARLEKDLDKRLEKIEAITDRHAREFISKELLAEKLGRFDERIEDVKKDVNFAHDKIRSYIKEHTHE